MPSQSSKPLYKHQIASIKFIEAYAKKNKDARVFDASDAGTAKTRVQLEVFAKRRRKKSGCMLVFAPRSLLRNAWGDDAARFVPDMKISIAYASNRVEAFKADADIYITNIDAAKWVAAQRPDFFKRFDTIVIDESSMIKHHTSGRSRAIEKIKHYFRHRSALTGTPNSNTITDIWNQIYFLDNGRRLGNSFYAFRNTTCTPRQVGPKKEMVKWEDKDGAEDAVSDLLSDISIRHEFDKCVDIPATSKSYIYYYSSPKQMKAYANMETHAIAVLKSGNVTAVNQASIRTKLLQIASGAVYETESKYHVVDLDRYEMIGDLIEARKHSLVFYMWRHQLEELVREAEQRKIKFCVMNGDASDKQREEMVREYQAGFYQTMFAHPLSAAHGLTLTRGTATIWASPTDNLEWWVQGNRRQARAGQTKKTEIISVIAKDTIEERMYFEVLETKNKRMSGLLDLLKK